MCKLVKWVRNCVVFWKNLHSWQKFYTTAGRDGRDKCQVCISILYDRVQCRVLHCKWTPGRKVHSSHGWLNFLDFSAAERLEDLFQYFWIFEHIIMKCLSLVPLVRCATLIYSLVLSLLTLSICKMASHVILHHRITLNRRIFKALKSPFC